VTAKLQRPMRGDVNPAAMRGKPRALPGEISLESPKGHAARRSEKSAEAVVAVQHPAGARQAPDRGATGREGPNGRESGTTMDLGRDRRQKSVQMELPLRAKGEAPSERRSGESPTAVRGDERSGLDQLMERVVESSNARAAIKRVRRNKGSPGVDGMTVDELAPHLAEHWLEIREQLLAGTYRPQPVRRHQIPKKGGGVRELGIPTVLDRMIQQAILQVLTPIFDPTFSEHSHGFRPERSAHDAVRAAQRYIQEGCGWVVDVDLEKFFDRVNHDVLMGKLAKRIGDKRLLRLIRRFLEAGMMADGVATERHEGTPQGGPLSPLLANVLLDAVDKELEKRGIAFSRYADDCNLYLRSERAATDAMEMLRGQYAKLKLKVNEAKSAVARPWERKFLSYSFWYRECRDAKPRVAPQAIEAMKDRVRQITSRNGGRSMRAVIDELCRYLPGWKRYFRLAQTPKIFADLDAWLRRRIRALQLKQWRHTKKIYRELRKRGVPDRNARGVAAFAGRWWEISTYLGTSLALPTHKLYRAGLPRLAAPPQLSEPPDA
jgi:RNA-directed DNA polymerase